MQDTKKTEKREEEPMDNREGMTLETPTMLKDQQGRESIQIMKKITTKKKERMTPLGTASMGKKITIGTIQIDNNSKNRNKITTQTQTMKFQKIIDVY